MRRKKGYAAAQFIVGLAHLEGQGLGLRRTNEDQSGQAILALAMKYGRYGYRRITALLQVMLNCTLMTEIPVRDHFREIQRTRPCSLPASTPTASN